MTPNEVVVVVVVVIMAYLIFENHVRAAVALTAVHHYSLIVNDAVFPHKSLDRNSNCSLCTQLTDTTIPERRWGWGGVGDVDWWLEVKLSSGQRREGGMEWSC